jgi:hypothetical protein
MMSIECRLVLVGILAFAGCASAPQQPAGSRAAPVASASTAPESGIATGLAAAPASAAATASETEGSAGGTSAAATTEGAPTVQIAKLADPNPVTCRDQLIQGSNVLRTRCMTRADWKVYEQAQRIWAQEMLLRMQGLKR